MANGAAFTSIILKLPRMKKPQSFTLYPYDGSDFILLQSDTRIMRLNVRTGDAVLSLPHSSGSYGPDLLEYRGAYAVQITKEELTTIQGHLWTHSGVQTYKNSLSIENKALFSE